MSNKKNIKKHEKINEENSINKQVGHHEDNNSGNTYVTAEEAWPLVKKIMIKFKKELDYLKDK